MTTATMLQLRRVQRSISPLRPAAQPGPSSDERLDRLPRPVSAGDPAAAADASALRLDAFPPLELGLTHPCGVRRNRRVNAGWSLTSTEQETETTQQHVQTSTGACSRQP